MRLIDADAIPEVSWDPSEERAFRKIIDEQPTIEAEPVRSGRWVIDPGIGCKCSACGFDIGNDLDFMEYVEYCPACGAKMERWE